MNKTVDLFEDVLKLFGVCSLILLVVGYIDIRLFYSNFNLDISDYISTSEIILRSLDNLGTLLLVMLVQLIVWLTLFTYLFEHDLDKPSDLKEGLDVFFINETIARAIRSKTVNILIFVSIVGIISTVLLTRFYAPTKAILVLRDYFFINLWVTTCIYVFFLRATKHFLDILKTKKQFGSKIIVTLVVFLIVILLSLWFKNIMLSSRILKYGSLKKIEISLGNGTKIITSDSLRYIGKTENYYFFVNRYTKEVDIYPTSEVEYVKEAIK